MPKKRPKKKAPRARRGSPDPAAELPWIAEPLRPLAEPIDQLELDPRNARTHDEANLQAIRASLERFGQRKPIVVNRDNRQVEAGNGTLLAARQLGWTHLAVVWVDDDPASQTGFAIADNRTAQLAAWDDALLAELLEENADTDRALYDDLLMAELFDDASKPAAGKQAEGTAEPMPDTWSVVVDCRDEDDQKAFFELMQKEGRTCRLLTL